SILLAEKLTGSNFTNLYRNLRIVLRYEKKMKFMEQPAGPPDPETADPDTIDKYYESVNLEQEVACLMLSSMSPDLQRTLEKYNAYDMLKELKTMFEEQTKHELFETIKAFHACKVRHMGKTIAELHAMLKLHEKGAKGKDKGKNKLAYAPKPKIPPPPPKREHPTKDSLCHHCKEVGHWKRNCPSYQAELKKRKSASIASTSGMFIIELYAFPNKTWVYDTCCGTHICNTSKGLRESMRLKHGALSLYMGNGMRAAVGAIGSFDLILPSGLIIVLDNCHFAPSVTRYNVFYFNAIPRDGIYEIDMHNLYPNVSSMFNVSNKRVKYSLDSSYLWHFRLCHINKKRMDKLQLDGVLQRTHDESLKKCKSCIFGKMTHKSFPHQVERAKDLLGLIHTDVCGPFRTVSREGASYFITFTDDFSPYGYVYLMKHKHEVFETFKVF
ncbi:zinc finger, CCHC-type containing protein, partial [Tanacetum coccineum]